MRVRFAPSPTGALHIGGARTALFNWLLARGAGGRFVLRIEDTDRERSTPENVEQILDALRWLELDWDEGPIFQSANEERHREAVETAARVRARLSLERDAPRTSGPGSRSTATTAATAVRTRATGRYACASPTRARRRSRTSCSARSSAPNRSLDDLVIARADGTPLYNLAVAVDDLDTEITHVVRGNDHLTNTAKQLLIIDALGASRRATATSRCSTGRTERSSPSATAPRPSRSCATAATFRRGAQLPRAARLGHRRRRDDALDRGACQPLRHHARPAQPRPVRRAEAALAQRPLHARAEPRRS